ncbi:MAG: 30S ribosomal protein S4 [Candidatus Marsarchaeota archaeon]|nr:30S ribosomal protein S4 [Candidatus Marsarchaeota archaeon]MCL5431332.1 30S ribosomal protein S4 [Candidatus Marsarchaeota archaeon]
MGAPRRNRKKYEKPKDIWNLQRINSDNSLKDEFGLKNMKELWKVQSEISNLRANIRTLLSGVYTNPIVEQNIINRLVKYGISSESPTLDSLLDLKENAILERRLQSVVFRHGLARTMKQARQLITHGFIAINGKKVNRPGMLVSKEDEPGIGYYKPIKIELNKPEHAEESAASDSEANGAEAAATQEATTEQQAVAQEAQSS